MQAGKIKRAILTKYEPKVVLRMIRVLVWDWEVAREVCWPPRKEHKFPDVESLVLYRVALSGATITGFDYTGARRGEPNTYYMKYLKDSETTVKSDDPF